MEQTKTLLEDKSSRVEKKNRKVIEFELEEPVSFKILSSQTGESEKQNKGEVLTLNDQGILLLTPDLVEEGSFINLSFKFKELGPIVDILGKVKKVEESEEHDFYVGVELYSPEKIKAEALSSLFPEKMESFNLKLKKSLLDYFKREKSLQKKESLAER